MPLSNTLKLVVRLSAYLLIAACTQSALETYGCACASRSYTAEEISAYRAGAAKNDLKALAEMEEYYMWRRMEHDEGSAEYRKEAKLERSYRARRLALNDPKAIEIELDDLIWKAVRRNSDTKVRERALVEAGRLAAKHQPTLFLTDVQDPQRKQIDAMKFIERELELVRKLGNSYYVTRERDENRAEQLLKKSNS